MGTMLIELSLKKNDSEHNEQHYHHDVVPKVYKPRKHLLVFLEEFFHQK
jgi:hypothetical protein